MMSTKLAVMQIIESAVAKTGQLDFYLLYKTPFSANDVDALVTKATSALSAVGLGMAGRVTAKSNDFCSVHCSFPGSAKDDFWIIYKEFALGTKVSFFEASQSSRAYVRVYGAGDVAHKHILKYLEMITDAIPPTEVGVPHAGLLIPCSG